ncbi:hypothetical protein N7523_006253 [Penicillium sp. IBT 18751x]|nr:hypothetical protein N7523_006253 [Penicillium sp. IBT 18751x]
MAQFFFETPSMLFGATTPLQLLFGVLLISSCLWTWRWSQHRSLTPSKVNPTILANEPDVKNPGIAPLTEFNWETTESPQFRPFRGKEKFNLTMALENLEPSELILIDKTYKERLGLRKALLQQHHDIVVAVNEDGNKMTETLTRAAVSELYTFVLGVYLPTRYPSMFRRENETFKNLVTGETWPATLTTETPTIQALEILMQTIDEDFLILLPDSSPSSADQPIYKLEAYSTCFPSGFNPREKLGRRLADIHGPVPGYAEKLERSMDRFFARVEVGKYVKRVNWSITTGAQLFAAFGEVHGSSANTSEDQRSRAMRLDELDLSKTVLRCERQTLHRLPRSRALVFAFHTYTYPIQMIKDEGLGEELAIAIDGLVKGNVPAMNSYKRADVWGEAVKEFMRS